MESSPEKEYLCTLTPELIKKAEKELNEKPQWRERDIQALRDMVNKQQDLFARTDDAFLLRFLRARKFDYDRAFSLLLNFYRMKAENKDLFVDLKPSTIQHVLRSGLLTALEHRDREGRKVIVLKPGRWNPETFPLFDMYKTWFVILSKLIEDEETQVNGIITIMDLKDVGWVQVRALSPFYAKKVTSMIQECFPLRLKGIHYIHEPSMFDILFSIVRPFLKEKIVKRLHFHGQNVSALHEFVSPENLPEEYNGVLKEIDIEAWTENFLKYDAQFEEEFKYGFKKLQQANKSVIKEDATGECLMGTYRKLEVD
ncbi:alpha-tocopherol transfer protein-like [Octopus sinensis]|uniref:Alpha-tocopherol transfer protein-like n=1 Tax=Octopus sinensis TaxID=2607531 RepID=A0A6P7TGS5_9MOLL|nr:alpha-tocopherol transfer protein-like [Octopus sinensis]XP_029650680.1 alpha-tocopherol transfer protein-like [Octopus sinensis]XP_036368847.1 alpha-tocopherol transfer protein-like [Octopus sinensis]